MLRGPSKILKNISWPINMCLKYFMTPTKTLRPPSYILNVRSILQRWYKLSKENKKALSPFCQKKYFHVMKCKIYIVTSSTLHFKQRYAFCKLYPMKRTFLPERNSYLTKAFNYKLNMVTHYHYQVCNFSRIVGSKF